jgi:hypothetical protein
VRSRHLDVVDISRLVERFDGCDGVITIIHCFEQRFFIPKELLDGRLLRQDIRIVPLSPPFVVVL